MKTVIVLCAVVILLVACSGPATTVPELPPSFVLLEGNAYFTFYRAVDKEARVACWIYSGIDKGGIDCLPLSQTGLDGGY